jgi:signal transduction histidine kinase
VDPTMSRTRALYARGRAVDPFKIDLLFAGFMTAAFLIEVALSDPNGLSRSQTVAAGLIGIPFPIAYRRRKPLLAAFVFAAVMVAQEPFDSFFVSRSDVAFAALLILLYSIGRDADGRRFWLAVAVLFLGVFAASIMEPEFEGLSDAVWIVGLLTPPVLAGRAMRSRSLLQRMWREKARAAEEEREIHARSAIEEERSRIAGELQAVVANALSEIVVQADTVPRVLATGDTGRAQETLAVIEETGRDALAEMRRLLGVLRREGERASLAPQPGLGRLGALADRIRERDLDVSVVVEGDVRALPSGVDLTAYRVLQEALEAASEKGASRAAVVVRYGEEDLGLQVRDDREGGASVQLPALRDRVGMYGGHLRVESVDGDGCTLEARLPISDGGR